MKGYLYIRKSFKNNRYYIGSTIDLEKRDYQHKTGQVKSTRYIMPTEIIYFEKYDNISDARKREKYLKKLKSRKLIENLINGRLAQLG